jgi:hypothetical protein
MATFASLTPAQQKTLTDFTTGLLRPLAGDMGRFLTRMDAAQVAWNAQVSAVHTLLDNGAVVPDATNLVGAAASLTKEEIATIGGYMLAILSAYNTATARQNLSKACGAGNMIS